MGHKQIAFYLIPPPLQVTFIQDTRQQKQINETGGQQPVLSSSCCALLLRGAQINADVTQHMLWKRGTAGRVSNGGWRLWAFLSRWSSQTRKGTSLRIVTSVTWISSLRFASRSIVVIELVHLVFLSTEWCNFAGALLPLFLKQHIHSRYCEHPEILQISDLHSQAHNRTQRFCMIWVFIL